MQFLSGKGTPFACCNFIAIGFVSCFFLFWQATVFHFCEGKQDFFLYFYSTDFLPFKWKEPLNIVRQSWTVICLGTVCQSSFPEMWFAYNSGEEKSDLRGMDHLSLCFLQAEIILQLIDFCHCFLSPHRGNLFIHQTTILHASMIGLWSLLFSTKHWVRVLQTGWDS